MPAFIAFSFASPTVPTRRRSQLFTPRVGDATTEAPTQTLRLDGNVATDRQAVWSCQLSHPPASHCTLVAENGDALVGFARTGSRRGPDLGRPPGHTARRVRAEAQSDRWQPPGSDGPDGRRSRERPLPMGLEQNASAQPFYEAPSKLADGVSLRRAVIQVDSAARRPRSDMHGRTLPHSWSSSWDANLRRSARRRAWAVPP